MFALCIRSPFISVHQIPISVRSTFIWESRMFQGLYKCILHHTRLYRNVKHKSMTIDFSLHQTSCSQFKKAMDFWYIFFANIGYMMLFKWFYCFKTYLFSEDNLCLTSKTTLFSVVSSLSCGNNKQNSYQLYFKNL